MAAGKPPGPEGQFPFGNTLQYMRDPLGFLTQAAREHGDFVKLRLGGSTNYALFHPLLVQEVLKLRASEVIKDRLTRMIIPILGRGLLTSEGDFWRHQRKLAMPAFQRGAIERYAGVMVDHALRLRDSWEVNQSCDIHEDMMGLTLGIVAKTLFDAEVGTESRDVGECIDVIMHYYLTPWKFFKPREWLPTRDNRRFKAAVTRLDEIILGIIRHRRELGDNLGDLLSHLLAAQDDDGVGMTDSQLRDECVTLFLAGHETTALVLTYTFLLLCNHPKVEATLLRELDEILGGRPPTASDVPRLRYVDWVIKESMRLYPPAWGIGREAIEDFEIEGYAIKKGDQLIISQWVLHRDPRWFAEPEAFRPERWDNDLGRSLPKGAYIPFGDGPRVCIGNHFAMMEAVLLLATLVQRHRLESAPGETLVLDPSITLRPRSGTRMIVRARAESVPFP